MKNSLFALYTTAAALFVIVIILAASEHGINTAHTQHCKEFLEGIVVKTDSGLACIAKESVLKVYR